MKNRSITSRVVVAAVISSLCIREGAALMSDAEQAHIKAEVEATRVAVQQQDTPRGKHSILRTAYAKSESPYVKKYILEMTSAIEGPELEPFLLSVLGDDADVRLRIAAVKALAEHGTTNAVQPLLNCAEKDPEGEDGWDCVRYHTSARRDAYFALSEIGLRYPAARSQIAQGISNLPITADDLKDPKIQALYVLTQDRALLTPFYERLQSTNAKERVNGVVAFRFLKLNRAPKELVGLIDDPSQDVRSWVALVLGEIGDTETVPALLKAAQDTTLDRGTRCNAIYSLGHMHAKGAEALLRQLLNDDSVKVNAAIALSQITGQRHPLVPQGYRLE